MCIRDRGEVAPVGPPTQSAENRSDDGDRDGAGEEAVGLLNALGPRQLPDHLGIGAPRPVLAAQALSLIHI